VGYSDDGFTTPVPQPPWATILGPMIRGAGNLQGFTMNSGERVRGYLVALGTEVDLHTLHWHGEGATRRSYLH